MTKTFSELPSVTPAERARILTAPRNSEAHQRLMADIPAMSALEVGGKPSGAALSQEFSVVAWNVERCLFPEKSAAHIAAHAPSIVLVSEMDCGMARTGQRNTTAAMAEKLDMAYAYGVEFYELDLGGPTERARCTDDFNAIGWHGNAILSSVPFEKTALFRLDEDGYWFVADGSGSGDSEQPRLGGRMAVAAILQSIAKPVCVVSTHLESNATAAYRHQQFEKLLDMVDEFAPGLPVLIGGDLNTGNHIPPDFDWRVETLFDLARDRGYTWDFTPDGVTTRNSLITPHDTRRMKLDWFAARGFAGNPGPLIPSLDPDGVPLSDHEAVMCSVRIAGD